MRTTLNQNDFRCSSRMLPQELIDRIMSYITFEKCVYISDYAANRQFDLCILNNKTFYENLTLSIIKWLHLNKIEGWVYKALHACAESGKILEIQYILNIYKDFYSDEIYIVDALDRIPLCGDLTKVKWLYEKFPEAKQTIDSMNFAIKSKNLEIVKYIWLTEYCIKYEDLLEKSICYSTLEILKFFIEDKNIQPGDSFLTALSYKKVDMIIYLLPTFDGKNELSTKIYKNENMLYHVIETGSLELVKLICENGYVFDKKCIELSVKCNFLDIFTYLKKDNVFSKFEFMELCRNGNFSIVKNILENNLFMINVEFPTKVSRKKNFKDYKNSICNKITTEIVIDGLISALTGKHEKLICYLYNYIKCSKQQYLHRTDILYAAIKANNLDFLKSAFNNGFRIQKNGPIGFLIEPLVQEGKLEIVKFLFQNCIEIEDSEKIKLINTAIRFYQKHVADWFLEYFINFAFIKLFKEDILTQVIMSGYLDILIKLHKLDVRISDNLFDIAVRYNRLDIVKWLYENKIYPNEYDIDTAIKFGNIDIVNYLLESDIIITYNANISLHYAAKNNNFEMVKQMYYLCDSNNTIIDSAFTTGNLEMIKWLHNHGSIFTDHAWSNAIYKGYYQIVKYLFEIFLDSNPETRENQFDDLMFMALTNDSFELVKFLYEEEMFRIDLMEVMHTYLMEGIDKNDKYIVEWIKFRYTNETNWYTAAKNNDTNTILMLHKNRVNGDMNRSIRTAIKYNSLDVLNLIIHTDIDRCNNYKMHAMIIGTIYSRFDIVEMIFNKYGKDAHFIELAVINTLLNNKINLVQWLFKRDYKFSKFIIGTIAMGNLTIVRWCYKKMLKSLNDDDKTYFVEKLQKNTNPDVTEWFQTL